MHPEMSSGSSVLHALRVCGFASTERVAQHLLTPPSQVENALLEHETAGWVRRRTGRLSGWMLTPEGKAEHDRKIAISLKDAAWQQPVVDGYGQFLDRNRELKQVCTAWQLRPQLDGSASFNDHEDREYDASVISELSTLNDKAADMFRALAKGAPRFENYPLRLDVALRRLHAGDNSAFATPMSESYHCIWMELHQDLLVSLGRERDEADGH